MLVFLSPKREIILELNSNQQSRPPAELNDPTTSFICSISDGTRADSGNTNHLTLINHLPLPYGQNLQQMLAKLRVHFPLKFKYTPQTSPQN